MDNWNKLRNICTKEIGAKMKKKEDVGTDDTLPVEVVEKLDSLTAEIMRVCVHACVHACVHLQAFFQVFSRGGKGLSEYF